MPTGRQSNLRWTLAIATGAFALGAWLFRPASTFATRSPSLASGVPHSGTTAIQVNTRAPHADATVHRIDDDLATTLRGKLANSVSDVLQALNELSKTDPTRAIDLAQELGRTDAEKAVWVRNATQQWADRDPAAAWQWLRGLSRDRMQELAGGELGAVVLGAMAARDPQAVVSSLSGLLREGNASESVSTPVAVHLGLTALVEHDKAELARTAVDAWAKDPAKLGLEASAFEAIAGAFAKSQPRETGDWLRSLPATEERDAAFATLAAAWAKQDPRAALQWAETLPANAGQQAALRRTVSDWIEEYPDQIAGWLGDYLARVPPNPTSDTLIETVINNSPALRAAPQAALQWTNLLSDPAKRVENHERIALRWSEQDPTAAIAFVTQSTVIPPERKAALVQRIQLAQVAMARPQG
jgi:hypothetical protein